MYYRDPDGNKVELQVDNFDVPEDADAFMSGPLYEENPMGTDIDAEEWAREILSRAAPDGGEVLEPEEVRARKTRREIGPRMDMPEAWIKDMRA